MARRRKCRLPFALHFFLSSQRNVIYVCSMYEFQVLIGFLTSLPQTLHRTRPSVRNHSVAFIFCLRWPIAGRGENCSFENVNDGGNSTDLGDARRYTQRCLRFQDTGKDSFSYQKQRTEINARRVNGKMFWTGCVEGTSF